ncbi:MAG: SGNH/GDSL hydrolase family protein [Akkermansiaceae bacterium]
MLFLTCLTVQGTIKVMTIGDSLTEEYHFETPFSAPNSDPANANTMNWVEILSDYRGADISFGNYEGVQIAYPDYRRSGYEYNWGIPGYDTVMWMNIIQAPIGIFDFSLESFSRRKMRQQYNEVDVIVVMVGGNDVRANYGDLYDPEPGDLTPEQFKTNVKNNLGEIIDEIRSVRSNLPIVLADIPHLSAAPDIIADHPDASKRANVIAVVDSLNQELVAFASSRGVNLAPISSLTTDLLSPDTYYIGAIEMIKNAHPENPSNYLFCKAGLHPSTNGQARIANTLLTAINSATSSNTLILPDREILINLLNLDPDQPYLDWVAGKGIIDTSFSLDSDGDGIPNLGEYLLGLEPLITDTYNAKLKSIDGSTMLTMDYSPDAAAGRLAETSIKQSNNLIDWNPISASNIHSMANGTMQVRLPSTDSKLFLKMEFKLRP